LPASAQIEPGRGLAGVGSPRVRVSWSTTKTPFSPSAVLALVGPRPMARASARATVFEIAAASSPLGQRALRAHRRGSGACAGERDAANSLIVGIDTVSPQRGQHRR
jgi:hypothetical protein